MNFEFLDDTYTIDENDLVEDNQVLYLYCLLSGVVFKMLDKHLHD